MNLHEHKQEMFLKEEEDQPLAVILSIICMVVTIIAVFTFGVLPTNEFVFMFFCLLLTNLLHIRRIASTSSFEIMLKLVLALEFCLRGLYNL